MSPVTARGGRFDYQETDLSVPSPGMDFAFTRYYNSQSGVLGPFGYGWSHTYHWPLQVATNGDVSILTPNLVPIQFSKQSDGSLVATTSAHGFSLTTAPDGLFHLTYNRLTYDFDASNRLSVIRDVAGHATSLAYDPVTTDARWGSLLTQITDSVGRTYVITWTDVPLPVYYPPENGHMISALRQMATGRVIQYVMADDRPWADHLVPEISAVCDSAYTTNIAVTYGYDFGGDYRTDFTLTTVVDRTGSLVYAMHYNSSRQVYEYQYRNDPVVTYTRYPDHTIGTLVLNGVPSAITKRADYTSDNRLTHAIDFDGTEITYTWDSTGANLLQNDTVDPRGFRTLTTYFTGCGCGGLKPLSITDPYGGVTTFEYDTRGNMTKRTDALGRETTYQYDDADHLVSVTDPASNRTVYTYNQQGLMATKVDVLGLTTAYSYDSLGQLTRVTDTMGLTTHYEYNDGGFRIFTAYPGGGSETLQRDAAGRVVQRSNAMDEVTTYAYTATDKVAQVTDPRGHVTTYRYGMSSDVLRYVTMPLSAWELGYDAYGNPTTDSRDPYLTHEHNVWHQRKITWRGNGQNGAIVYSHDAVGNTTGIKDVPGPVSGDPTGLSGALTSYGFDGNNRLVSVTTPDGATTTRAYDLVGNLISESDPYGNVTTFAYDVLDRSVRKTDGMGRVTQWAYDALGRKTSETDPGGHVTGFGYDPAGHLVATSDPMGHVTTFAYSPAGDLVAITDARSKQWSFEYDQAHRLVLESNPLGHTTTYGHDPDGNLVRKTDAKGQVTVWDFDANERPVEVSYADDSQVTLDYNDYGDLTEIQAPGYALTQSWQNRRLTQQEYGFGPVVEYGYDDARRLHRVGLATGFDQTEQEYLYHRDALGRVVKLEADFGTGATVKTTYSYGLLSEPLIVSRPNGVVTTYDYNQAGEVTSIRHRKTGLTLPFFTYAYNDEGLRVARWTGAGQSTYEYDSAHRLVASTAPSEVETFGYDEVGNVTAIWNNAGLRLFAHDDANRLVSETGTTPATYEFDPNGNLTARHATGDERAYFWNPRDKLHQVSVNGSPVTTFVYHPLSDLMLAKQIPGQPLRLTLWQGQNPLVDALVSEDVTPTVTVAAHYAALEGYDQIESHYVTANTTAYTPLRDALLSVYQLRATNNGALAASFGYSAYGEPRGWSDSANTRNRFTYTGREADPDAQSYYYRARWYQPQIARFASKDPLGDRRTDGPRPYTYIADTPTSDNDPTGECACMEVGRFQMPGPCGKEYSTGDAAPALYGNATCTSGYAWYQMRQMEKQCKDVLVILRMIIGICPCSAPPCKNTQIPVNRTERWPKQGEFIKCLVFGSPSGH